MTNVYPRPLSEIRERAGADVSITEEFPTKLIRTGDPFRAEFIPDPTQPPKTTLKLGTSLLVAEYCSDDMRAAMHALATACFDRSELVRKLDALVAKAKAVVDSEGNSHEDDSGGSFHYMVEVDYGALHEMQAALAEVSA